MGFLDFFRKPKEVKAEPDHTYSSRFCVGHQDRQQLNSVTEDGKRGICPACGRDCRRTAAGTSFWHMAEAYPKGVASFDSDAVADTAQQR